MTINKLWRTFATGLSFSTFGVMGIVFALVVSPLILVFFTNEQKRKRAARCVVQKSFMAFLCWMRFLGVLSWKTREIERLSAPGQLIVCNHITLIDVIFLIAHIPNAAAVVKAALKRNPFTYAPVKAAGYCTNDEGPKLIQECVQELRSGASLVIFPEGTRTPPGQIPHLKRGAMLVALTAGIDLTIVNISCQPLSLTKGNPWWRVPDEPMSFTITVQDQLSIAPYQAQFQSDPPKAARALSQAVYRSLF